MEKNTTKKGMPQGIKNGLYSFCSGLICILIGILFGFILMLCLDPKNALRGLGTLLGTGFKDAQTAARTLYLSAPMMLTGLSIAFSFKLGLFNIGITSQFAVGGFVALVCGISGMPWFPCLIFAMLSGAFMGFIPGLLKAKFNVNEVLSGIMLNWISYYIIGMIGQKMPSRFKDKIQPDYLRFMPDKGRMPQFVKEGPWNSLSWGLVIALILVILIHIILNYTKFGFELKLSGSNKYAAKYAGINMDKNIIIAVTISGALAGIGGYMFFAQPTAPLQYRWSSTANSTLSNGFDGVAVSLIAQNSPLGCILSAILLNYIDASQTALKSVSSFYNVHYTELIRSIIIYLASFSSFVNMMLRKIKFHKVKDDPEQNKEEASKALSKFRTKSLTDGLQDKEEK